MTAKLTVSISYCTVCGFRGRAAWLAEELLKAHEGDLAGVTLAPVNDMGDLAGFQHLEERGYWLPAPLPNGVETRAPGLVARMSETPMSVRSWAPALGEHNRQVLTSMLGLTDEEIYLATGGKTG